MNRDLHTAIIARTAGFALFAAGATSPVLAQKEFADCKPQQEVKGATLSIRAHECPNARLVADDKLPGFVLESSGPDGKSRRVVIRTFAKFAPESIHAALPAIRKASPGLHTAGCVLKVFRDNRNKAVDAWFVLSPTGKAETAWLNSERKGGSVKPPCGALGVQSAGDLYFQVMPDDPATVVFVDKGSEIQIFDPDTLKTVKTRASSATPKSSEPSAGKPRVTDTWLGRWPGVEGLFVDVAADGRHYKLTIGNADGEVGAYKGVADGAVIRFQRDGQAQAIRAGAGAETGLKWLDGKTNCLIIKDGEGFCR